CVDSTVEREQRGLAASRGADHRDVVAEVDSERHVTQSVHRLAVHRILLAEMMGEQQRRSLRSPWGAHVASSRSVRAMGARAASQAGYRPASDPVTSSTMAAVRNV